MDPSKIFKILKLAGTIMKLTEVKCGGQTGCAKCNGCYIDNNVYYANCNTNNICPNCHHPYYEHHDFL